MVRYVLLVCVLLQLAAAGCADDGAGSGDGGADSDSDSDSDSDTNDYWEWGELVIPGGFMGHGSNYRVHATAADDATLCVANWTNGTGGVAAFDGAAFETVLNGFMCDGVFGLDAEHLWVFGTVDETFEPRLYGRSGGAWSLAVVDGADDSCRYEAIYGTSTDDVTLVGTCGPVRQSWVPGGAGAWIAGAAAVPTDDAFDTIYGVAALPDGDVFYGYGLYESAGGTDLGYPSERALWAGGSALDALLVLDDVALLSYDGAAWSELAGCPYDIWDDDYPICWSSGARDGATGDVYVGGGRGGSANENIDDWRLDRISAVDGAVSSLLAPCGGDEPRCGVDDLSLSPDGVLFAIASGPQPRLMWHALPSAD
jgi:hypothetical protein